MRRKLVATSLAMLVVLSWVSPLGAGEPAGSRHSPPEFQPASPPLEQTPQPRPADLRRQARQMRDLAEMLRDFGKQEVADQLMENAAQLLRQAEKLEKGDSAHCSPDSEGRLAHELELLPDQSYRAREDLDRIGWGICDSLWNHQLQPSGTPGSPVFEGVMSGGELAAGEGEQPGPERRGPSREELPGPLWRAPARSEETPLLPIVPKEDHRQQAPACLSPGTPGPTPGIVVPFAPQAPAAPQPFQPGVFPAPGAPLPPAEYDRLGRAARLLREAAAELEAAGRTDEADCLRGKAERLEAAGVPPDSLPSLRAEIGRLKRQVSELNAVLETMRAEMKVLAGRLEHQHRLE